jgi:hypothetical protein
MRRLRATIAEIERRISEQELAVIRLDVPCVYRDRVRQNVAALTFANKRLAVEALAETIVGDGGEPAAWRIEGRIPVTPSTAVVSQTSAYLEQNTTVFRFTLRTEAMAAD